MVSSTITSHSYLHSYRATKLRNLLHHFEFSASGRRLCSMCQEQRAFVVVSDAAKPFSNFYLTIRLPLKYMLPSIIREDQQNNDFSRLKLIISLKAFTSTKSEILKKMCMPLFCVVQNFKREI